MRGFLPNLTKSCQVPDGVFQLLRSTFQTGPPVLQPPEQPQEEEKLEQEESSSEEEESSPEAEPSISGEAIWAALQSSDEEDNKIATLAKTQTEKIMLKKLAALYKAETPEEAVRLCETIEGATEVSLRHSLISCC